MPHIPRPCGKMDKSGPGMGQREDPAGYFVDGCLASVAAVVCASQIAVFRHEEQTRHDVLHIDEVAGLLAIAKDRYVFSGHCPPQECRNSGRVGTRRILSRSKNVEKAKRCRFETFLAMKHFTQILAVEFTHGIRTLGT